MLEVRIVSAQGSLYFAAEATPYNLQSLRMHVRDLTPRSGDVQVEVRVEDETVVHLTAWLHQLADAGVRVTRLPTRLPSKASARQRPDAAA